ncbi:MAG: hypothetical protein CO099_06085 [Bdellovibrio sp. CG_4_9_14_3_um_filter_39_7]|nr:MAG: hypothetical protein CO099_06085 [Bdellovibrio sp. CG_4_9_14_3_um_filter_39_7]
MILELASFLGTSVGGSLFGMLRDTISSRRQQAIDDKKLDHELRLADKKALKDYYESIHKPSNEGNYSPMSYVIAFLVCLLGVTYCYATITCFAENPELIIYSKDPSDDSRTISILFGAIEWDIANNKILSMSKIGLGYLMCYPIIFTLSQVITGDKPRSRR